MSFSADVKTELCKAEEKKASARMAECYGVWLFSTCFLSSGGVYVTENAGVARKMTELLASELGLSAELSFGLSRRQKPAYRVRLSNAGDFPGLLEGFGHRSDEPAQLVLRINRAMLDEEDSISAFLRGAFLCCGTVTNPQKAYHLEFNISGKELANGLYTLLSEIAPFSLLPAFTRRKGGYVIYIKESDQIENLLTYIGAPSAAMELMQVKMFKETTNDINRKVNFETANMDKTYSASARQIAAIAALSDAGELKKLPESLKELAMLRLDSPDMTLRELSEKLGVSRSGVNHRLQRLIELGKKYLPNEEKS